MSIKYKIDDAKKNKNLINDEIKLSRIKSKGGTTKEPRTNAPAWFNDFIDNKFNKLEEKVSGLSGDITILKKDVSNLRNDVSYVKKDVTNLKKGVSKLNTRFDNLVKVNNLKE